jgi:chloramphenicol-sensitive protein RarD
MTRDGGRAGLVYALAAFITWGVTPLYWRLLDGVPPGEVLVHRIVWSALLLAALRRGRWRALAETVRRPRTGALLLATAALIGANWYVYVWAVLHRRVLDASLGYYVNPLLSVALGVAFLGERLRRLQGAAAVLAAAGVAVVVREHGTLPWRSLALAGTFALYGLLRKRARAEAIDGQTIEALLLCGPALAGLAVLAARGHASFGPARPETSLLLAGGGVVSVLPLLWFVEGARRLDLKTVGFLQFIAPTLQFVVATALLGEPLPPARLAAFALIWAAVALYCLDAASVRRPRV